jgi:hypothetical protein
MEVVEYIYLLALVAIVVVLILHRMARAVFSWSTLPIPCLGHRSVRHILLGYLVFPSVPTRFLGTDSLSPLRIIILILFVAGTGVCNFVHVDNLLQASQRAAHIYLVLLIPLFLSGGREFPARLLGISLETYGFIH